jgi:hypothetical protein
MRKELLDRRRELRRLEPKRPQAPSIDYPPVGPNQEYSGGHSGIRLVHRVIHLVHVGPDAILECGLALPRNRSPLFDRLRILDMGIISLRFKLTIPRCSQGELARRDEIIVPAHQPVNLR